MSFPALLAFISAALCGGVALFGYAQERRSFVRRVFFAGQMALALSEICAGVLANAVSPGAALRWVQLGLIPTAFLPGCWLLFSLTFARPREDWKKWKGAVAAAFALPLSLVALFWDFLLLPTFDVFPAPIPAPIPLGWAGYLLHLLLLLLSILVLRNLETTLRAAVGMKRYRIKYMIVGLGSLFAILIYTSSQAILFSALHLQTGVIRSVAILAANFLIVVSLLRDRMEETEIYISPALAYQSTTVMVVGAYLVAVGLLTKAIDLLGGNRFLPLGILFIFLAVLGLIIVMLSDEMRQNVQRFIGQNLYRPRYDYRKEWMAFTQRTAPRIAIHPLCAVICQRVSETFGTPSVTIWLVDEDRERVELGGSTRFSEGDARALKPFEPEALALLQWLEAQPLPVDFHHAPRDDAQTLQNARRDYFDQACIAYAFPLTSADRLLGMMTLDARVTHEPLSIEDLDLLHILCVQAAGQLLNAQLAGQVAEAQRMEAFQSLSAFFIHDLKNLASVLSLTVQNLPQHYDNPAFRQDALHVISQSVAKMNTMCSRLSTFGHRLVIEPAVVDLNGLISETLDNIKLSLPITIHKTLQPLPPLMLDAEQIQKVVMNLILNARDAIAQTARGDGTIQVTTQRSDGRVWFSVTDNGCGMSRDFVERLLFRPMQTTKSEGLGIGLYHCKTIIEAHRGRIAVDSQEGEGATFRVTLPLDLKESHKVNPPAVAPSPTHSKPNDAR